MSGLAQISRAEGNVVSGSDRNFDHHRDQELFRCLRAQHITIYPQDGTGITPSIDEVIISNAIEHDNPDVKKARALSLPVIARSEFLARIFNASQGIGIAGSSGKSTITAMAAKIMDDAQFDPTVINGAIIPEYKSADRLGNVKKGSSPYMLIETDESDGSLVSFYPEISILANISKDHKPIPELKPIFLRFLENTRSAMIVNADCPYSQELIAHLPPEKVITFGFNQTSYLRAEKASLSACNSTFTVHDTVFSLPIPGKHNIANALAAISLGTTLKIPLALMTRALEGFRGVERRLELVGNVAGILVFDDFAHNPAKIAAAVETLKQRGSRLILIFQPHGFGPTKLLQRELIETFNAGLTSKDILIVLDIYYAGGTADQSISSADLVRGVSVPQAENIKDREKVITRVSEMSRPGDVIVVMGARDNTLSELARNLVTQLKRKKCSSQRKETI